MGCCIYIVRFENEGEDYVARDIQVNRNLNQYRKSGESYDEQMAFWVIDFILLGRMDAEMPVMNLS